MKLTLNQISDGEDEVIIRYRKINAAIEAIIEIAGGNRKKLAGVWEKQTIILKPEDIFYLESVDGTTFAYLCDKVAKVDKSLAELTLLLGSRGFFRCSKSMALNIHKISYLKSEPGNRIRATVENGEQVMISRKYAKQLRQILKGGADSDEE